MIILRKVKLLKTVNTYGFQVVSDTIGVPSYVAANSGKVTEVQYKLDKSTDSYKCCRDLFIRSAIAAEGPKIYLKSEKTLVRIVYL